MTENTEMVQEAQSGMELDRNSLEDLFITARWAQFLAIAGFVFMGLMVLIGLMAAITAGNTMNNAYGGALSGTITLVVMIIIGALYFFPLLYLYRFAKNTKQAITRNSQVDIAYAFKNLRAHYQFIGILMAIILGIYAIAFLFAILFGGFAGLM